MIKINSQQSTFPSSSILKPAQQLQNALQTERIQESVALLQQHPSMINHPLPNGEMILHFAIRQESVGLIRELLKHTSARSLLNAIKDHQGLTAADHALITQNKEIIALVFGHVLEAAFDEAQTTALNHQQLSSILLIQSQIQKAQSYTADATFPLHQAAMTGDLENLEKLLNSETLNQLDNAGMTPLHYAVGKNQEKAVDLLIQKGAHQDLLSHARQSLLHAAAIGGCPQIIEKLLASKECDPNAPDSMGITPLHYAITAEHLASAQSLIRYGANPQHGYYSLASPLQILLECTKNNKQLRDPLPLTNFQVLLFTSIAAPWLSSCCGGIAMLDATGYIAGTLSDFLMLKGMKSWLSVIGFLSLPVAQRVISSNFFGSFPAQRTLIQGCNVLSLLCRTYLVGKGIVHGAAACWNNKVLETYRPIRNTVVHFSNGYHAITHLVKALNEFASIF